MSIFDPTSESYSFYHDIFTQISINQLLAETGTCKLIKDMSSAEHIKYRMYLLDSVRDVQKPQKN